MCDLQRHRIIDSSCTCKESYIGENRCKIERFSEKNMKIPKKIKNLLNISEIIFVTSTDAHIKKNIENSIIALKQPSLNEQVEFNKQIIFQNGAT